MIFSLFKQTKASIGAISSEVVYTGKMLSTIDRE